MSVEENFPLCKNQTNGHLNYYGSRYHGYCLECANAGIEELVAERDELLALLRELVNAVRADGVRCGRLWGDREGTALFKVTERLETLERSKP